MAKMKITTYVPVEDASKVRDAIGRCGGGVIGNYSFCSFSTIGVGRFMPLDGAKPTIGSVNSVSEVEEERIEFVCSEEIIKEIILTIQKVHPYEEVPIEVQKLEDVERILHD